jgi:hypothetical protein
MHFHIKIVPNLLSMQNMWNEFTFHYLPSSTGRVPTMP